MNESNKSKNTKSSKLVKIAKIAELVRKQSEKYALKEGFEKDLAGMCGIASFTLCTELRKAGIQSEVMMGWYQTSLGWNRSHCWVKTGVHVIDVTATQFNVGRKVHITRDKTKRYKGRTCTECDFFNWDKWSKPSRYRANKLMTLK